MNVLVFGIAYFIANLLNVFEFNNMLNIGVAILLVILVSYEKVVFKIAFVAVILSAAVFHVHDYFDNSDQLDGTYNSFSAVATENEIRYDLYSVVEANVTVDGETFKSRVYLTNDDDLIQVSDVITGNAEFYKSSTKQGFDAEMYYKAKGIDVMTSVKNFEVVKSCDFTLTKWFSNLNDKIQQNLDETLTFESSTFVKGLVLGDKSDFSDELTADVSRAGISHILAVSGMHIGMLALLCITVFGKKYGGAISLLVIVAFIFIIGPTPSVLRASIMQFLMVLAWILNREYSSKTAIWTAFVLLMMFEPYIVFDVGFILSFASTIGIIYFYPCVFNTIKTANLTINKFIITPLCISICANIFTIFLVLYYFGYVSTVVVFTNIFLIPFVAILFPVSLIFIIISLFSLSFVSFFAFVIEFLVKICLFIVKLSASFKYAIVFSSFLHTLLLALIILLAISLFIVLKFKKTVIYSYILLFTAVNIAFSVMYYKDVHIDVLYAGDGSVVAVTSDFELTILDMGSDSYVPASDSIKQFILLRGYDEIDNLVITSVDTAHVRDLNLLDVNVLNFVYPQSAVNSAGSEILNLYLDNYNGEINASLPDYIRLYDDVDKKLAVGIFDTLYLHAFTTKQIDSLFEKVSLQADTVIIADKSITDYIGLKNQLELLNCKQVILGTDYESLSSVSGVFCRSTATFGDVSIENGGKYE